MFFTDWFSPSSSHWCKGLNPGPYACMMSILLATSPPQSLVHISERLFRILSHMVNSERQRKTNITQTKSTECVDKFREPQPGIWLCWGGGVGGGGILLSINIVLTLGMVGLVGNNDGIGIEKTNKQTNPKSVPNTTSRKESEQVLADRWAPFSHHCALSCRRCAFPSLLKDARCILGNPPLGQVWNCFLFLVEIMFK